MSKKNIIFLILVLFLGFAMMIGMVFLLFSEEKPIEETPTEPIVTLPDIGDDITIPTEEVIDQVEEIEKTGFDSQSLYWIEKLKEVTDVEADLNKGLTLDYLCEKYFYDEYKAYKNTLLLGDDENEEYPEEDSETLYQYLVDLAENFDFEGIVNHVDNLLEKYKFTLPHNYKIGNIYSDAIVLQHFDDMTQAAKVKNISKLKTPELMLIAAVNLGYKEQCAMYASGSSLCFKEHTRINIQELENITVSNDSTALHDKLMLKYFGNSTSDLEVVKITFVINFDLSNLDVYSFGSYFEKEKEPVEIVDESICIFDENGDVLYYLGNYSDEELEILKTEAPEYISEIESEIKRRANINIENEDTTLNENNTETEILEDFEGMAEPSIDRDNTEYDEESFNRFKETVYEIYIPKYETYYETCNRIYAINQVNNLDLPYFGDVNHYKELYASNTKFLQFVRNNQWTRNSDSVEAVVGEESI